MEPEAGSMAALEGHARERVAYRNGWAEAMVLGLEMKRSAAWKGPAWVADICWNEGKERTSHHH